MTGPVKALLRFQAGGLRRSLGVVLWALGLAAHMSQTPTLVAGGLLSAPLAPDEFALGIWRTEDGLPDNTVSAILQSSEGYIWVGTGAGLARFDGVRFVVVPPASVSPYVPIHVSALCQDRRGTLWVGTRTSGLFRLEDSQLQTVPAAVELSVRNVSAIAEDPIGALWVGTDDGLFRMQDGIVERYGPKEGLMHPTVTGVHIGQGGSVWVATRKGVCRIRGAGQLMPSEMGDNASSRSPEYLGVYEDRRRQLWAYGDTFLLNLSEERRFNYFGAVEPSSSRVWTIYEDQDGELWIATSGRGLFYFRDGKFNPLPLPDHPALSDVRCLFQDREGNLWLGSNGEGLLKVRRTRATFHKSGSVLPSAPATALAEDPSGALWIGTDGAGLWRLQQGSFSAYPWPASREGADCVWSLCSEQSTGLWIGSWGAGLWTLKPTGLQQRRSLQGLTDSAISALSVEASGALWIGTVGGYVQRLMKDQWTTFGGKQGLPTTPVTCLLAESNEVVWAAFEGHGLFSFVQGRFGPVREASLLGEQSIRSLLRDSRERLWVGTSRMGVAILAHGQVQMLNRQSGLPDDNVTQIQEDSSGNFWVATGKGLARLPKQHVEGFLAENSPIQAYVLGKEDGISTVRFGGGWPSSLRTGDGKLWFAASEGVVCVDPSIFVFATNTPIVLVESIVLDGKVIRRHSFSGSSPDLLEIPPGSRSLEIHYTAPSFVAPWRMQFRYRIDGLDQDWQEAGPSREARFSRLPDGHYVFRVTACNSDGVWSQTSTSMPIRVMAPVWRQGWFLAGSTLVIVGALVGMVRFVSVRRLGEKLRRAEQQRALERERTRIAQDMHDEIGAKLTRISFLSELAAQDHKASEQVESIAQTSRDLLKALDEIVWAVNPKNDTLEHLAAYLAQYATEYFQGTEVECQLNIQAQLPHQSMSSETRHNLFLAFEEALSNSLRHSKATHVRVWMRVREGAFQIEVTDDGCGFGVAPDGSRASSSGSIQSNGLKNMEARLQLIGGTCSIGSRPGSGTCVQLSIPHPQS